MGGQSLTEALESIDDYDDEQKESIQKAFDKAISNDLKKLENKSEIKGSLKKYTHHNSVWDVTVQNAAFTNIGPGDKGQFGRSDLVRIWSMNDPDSAVKKSKGGTKRKK